MACKQVLGIAYISVDGKTLETMGKSSLTLGGVERAQIMSNLGKSYTSAKPIGSEIECGIVMTQGVSADYINKICGAAITFECDSGQVYHITNATCDGKVKIESEGGSFTAKFFGDPAIEEGATV